MITLKQQKPLVVVTAPGPGSGKWRLVYHNFIMNTLMVLKAGYANLKHFLFGTFL